MKKRLVFIVLCLLLMLTAFSCTKSTADPWTGSAKTESLDGVEMTQQPAKPQVETPAERGESRGNNAVNTMNGGCFVIEDGWLYHAQGGSSLLYKCRPDGSESKDICKYNIWYAPCLNVADGWIYFIGLDEGLENICKVRTDGSDFQVLQSSVNAEHQARPNWLQVVDGRMYYIASFFDDSIAEEPCYRQALYSADLNGGDVKQIIDEIRFGSLVLNYDVQDGWIYYVDNGYHADEGVNAIYRCRIDGSDKTVLYENVGEVPHNPVRLLQLDEDWVYFADENYRICKMRLDGSGITLLMNEDDRVYLSNPIWLNGSKLYNSIEGANEYSKISCFNFDSPDEYNLIVQGDCSDVCLIDGWFYYFLNHDVHLWDTVRTKADGSVTETLVTAEFG